MALPRALGSLRQSLALVTLSALTTVAGCSAGGGASSSTAPAANATGPLSLAFAAGATAHHVPRDLLVAIAQTEGALDIPATRDVDVDNEVPAAGPLQLRRGKLDTLARGAALTGHTELELRQNADLALDAGAAVLAEIGARMGAKENDLASWSDAVAEMGGYGDDLHRQHYVHRVFATLARGGTFVGRDGEPVTLSGHDEIPPSLVFDLDPELRAQAATAQFPGAQYFPTSCVNKCDTTRAGNAVQRIVIHDTEGGWDASVATLQNDSGKSVHYIVDTDGKVGQFVPESYTAWHAGNYYYNQRTVGIEHVGYANKPYPEAQYASSAKLVSYLAKKYNVPTDRTHIIGHEAVPDGNVIGESAGPCTTSPKACEGSSAYGGADNHRDPGDWEWATYMPRIGGSAKCNDVTSLLNCSYDKTQAFKCGADGKVVVLQCNGPNKCQTQASGVDDLCDQTGAPPPAADGGAPPAPTASSNPGPGAQPGAAPDNTPSYPDPTPSSSGGCSVGFGGAGSELSEQDALAGIALAFGVALASRRRRRRSRSAG